MMLHLILTIFLRADLSPQTQLDVVQTHPASSTQLQVEQQAFIRIDYNSLVPVRFLLKAYYQGSEIEKAMRLGSQPLYPQGTGNALAWISFVRPTKIDQIILETFNDKWDLIGKKSFDIQWTWADTVFNSQNVELPEWIQDLSQYQTELTRVQLEKLYHEDQYFENMTTELLYLSFALYLLCQIVLSMSMAGKWRTLSLAPLALLIPALLYTAFSLSTGAQLWDILLLVTSTICLFYLILLSIAQKISRTPY